MDTTKLSSNWKALQRSIEIPKKKEPEPGAFDHEQAAATKRLKRRRSALVPEHSEKRKQAPQKRTRVAIWRPDADTRRREKRMATQQQQQQQAALPTEIPPAADDKKAHLGKYVAIDTEMIGTHSPTSFSIPNKKPPHDHSILARVSLVAYDLTPLYDAYVLPPPGTEISDYRTQFSGITPAHMKPANGARPFADVQREIADLLKGRVLVGHSVAGDLRVLGLSHPRGHLRDTAAHHRFREMYANANGAGGVNVNLSVGRREGGVGRAGVQRKVYLRSPGLKWLAQNILGWEIQGDVKAGHSSVEDARATMALFRGERAAFETEARRLFGRGAAVDADGASDGFSVVGTGIGDQQDIAHISGKEDAEPGAVDSEVDEQAASDNDRNGSPPVSKRKQKRKKGKKKGKYRRG